MAVDSSLAKFICQPGRMKNGLVRDFMIRYLISRDQFWWKSTESPWRLNLVHPWVKPVFDPVTKMQGNPYHVSEWRDRVLDLCEYELTHQFFGLSYVDLMNMDVAEFEEVEKRIHEMARKQSESMDKLRNGTNKNNEVNLLKELKK